MSSQGPRSGGTFDGGSAGNVWTNPGNVVASDNVYADCSLGATPSSSAALTVTNFGFTIPAGATIRGIKVEREGKCDINGAVIGIACQLIKGGAVHGTDKGGGPALGDTDGYATIGGATDLWGGTWTPADINASNFGFYEAVYNTIGAGLSAHMDHVRITVYYSEPLSGQILIF